jgi:2,4-dienoyl-CoA reductase-like NADH-dependent reductase (Old Yellow Enzyme family)
MTYQPADRAMFQPVALGQLTIDNRFVRSATWEGMATEDGSVTEKLTRTLVRLAKGGMGLVVTGHAYVLKQGQAGPWKLGVHHPSMKPGLTGLTAAVHEAGGKIAAQLAHAGKLANVELSGAEALGPSDGEGFRAMTGAEIDSTVEAFARAAHLCRESGFDAVQIHAAHGYLLSQFLSPYYNKRSDAHGGSLENRARFLLAVVRRVRLAVGPEYPVLCKMNSDDFLPGGFTVDEAVTVAGMLKDVGLDCLEISGGTGDSGRLMPVRPGRIKSPGAEGYFKEAAGRIKAAVDLPLILVGGIRSFEVARKLVADGVCDAVSLSRPLIREPELVNRWKSGDLRPSACVSDNLCFRPAMSGEGISCLNEKIRREKAARR